MLAWKRHLNRDVKLKRITLDWLAVWRDRLASTRLALDNPDR